MNQATHFLDASQIYGSDDTKAKSLREMHGGLLRVNVDNGKRFLPISSNKSFVTGDSRSTSQPQLTAMHTIWLREHNRLAEGLNYLNPHWDDETLYNEARRILIAEIQHITYNEWLPRILGLYSCFFKRKWNFNSVCSCR